MYIENPDEEENKSQSSSSPSVGAGGGGASVGTGGTSTGGNPSTIQPIQTNQPNQSFATVQDYLKANQPQGEAFGTNFVSNIGQGVGQAKSAIDTSAQNAQNEVSAATPQYNNDVVKNLFSSPSDTTNITNYQKQANAQYTGPTSFESSDQYTNAANAANNAAQTGAELESTGGREQLLQDQFGVYGQGNKGLDQTLLQNSSAYANVPPLAQSFKSIQDYLTAAANPINTSLIPAAQQAATTTQTNTTNDVTNAWQQYQNDLNAAANSKVNEAFGQHGGIPDLAGMGVTPEVLRNLLASPEEFDKAQAIANATNTANQVLSPVYKNAPPAASGNNQALYNYLRGFGQI